MNGSTRVVVDLHGHTLDLAFHVGRRLTEPLGGTTDVPQMRAGGVTAQLNASWTPSAALSGPHSHSVSDAPAALGAMLDYLDAQAGRRRGRRRWSSRARPTTCAARPRPGASP